jgi:molecular chaperone Hsp33
MIRCISSDGSFMVAAVDSTDTVCTAQSIHKTSAVASAALGRLLTASSLMGAMLKKEGASVTLKVKGGGPLGLLVAISDSRGNCRGFVEHPETELPLKADGKLDVGRAVGSSGLLCVIRDFGEGEPYTGQVRLVSGEIGEDVTAYFAESEQIPTACALGVLADKRDHLVMLSGGLLIQVLPGASEDAVSRLEKNVAALEPVTTMLAKGLSIEDMCRRALDGSDMEILDEFRVGYACPCSKERVERALATLKPEEIRSLADSETGKMEAKCHYCGRVYEFTEQELKALANSLQQGRK